MQNLPVNFALFYFSQCKSGDFAKKMGDTNYIGLSSVNEKESSWSKPEYFGPGNFFTRFLIPNILDPKMSIEQAFDKTISKYNFLTRLYFGISKKEGYFFPTMNKSEREFVLSPQTPQLKWQNANPSQLYLNYNSP